MKKIKILSFASLPLAMALLAGCGHTHTFSEEWNHDANKHWHDATCEHKDQVSEEGEHVFGNDNICDVCGYDKGGEPGPGPGPTEGKVTADEWVNAFGLTKPFYLADNYKLTVSTTIGGETKSGDLIVDGTKLKTLNVGGAETDAIYNEKADGKKYEYTYESDTKKWVKIETPETAADDLAEFFLPFGQNYNSFEFDAESNSYKCASITFEGVPFSDLVIKFENKQIKALALKAPFGDGGGVASVAISIVYGGQVIELPQAEEHTHSYFDNHDEYSHWKECSCGEQDQSSFGAHYDANWDLKCDVCNYDMPVEVTPGYYIRYVNVEGYASLDEISGKYVMDLFWFDADLQFAIYEVTSTEYNKFSLLTLSNDDDTQKSGISLTDGVVTVLEAGSITLTFDPAGNEGKGVLSAKKDEGPVVDQPIYGYSYNNGDYQPMIDCGKGAQWQLLDFYMAEKDIIKFADILNPEFPIEITYLEDNGNLQGFTNVDGTLTCGADGYYCFTLNVDEYGNASIVIGIGEEPAPLIDVYLMGDFDEWTSGMIMQLNSGSTTEYVIKNVHINAGGKFKVRQGTEDSGYCGTWKEEGEKNALNSGLLVLDNGDAKALVDITVDVYYESATEGGQGFGTYVELNSVARAYKGVGSYRGVDEKITFDFDKVENGYAQYFVNIPEGYVSADFVYSITRYDNLVEDIVVEQVDEGLKFVRQADNTFKYSGSATTLDLYLKVYLDGSGIGLYVANAAKPVDDRVPKTVTLKENQTWAFNDPNVVIFGWVWGPSNDGSWIEVDYEVGSTSTTVLLPPGTTGLLLVRCPVGTVTPNWEITSGSEPGRIYNKTKNVTIGTPDSYELDFVDYPEVQ